MMTIAVIGLDLAKCVFQAHGVDESGATVLVKKLHRKQMLPFFSKLPPCLIGVVYRSTVLRQRSGLRRRSA
jgi:transposase